MTDTCEECGRPFPVPIGAPTGNTVSPCFRLFYDGELEEDLRIDALLQCNEHTIARLKARVRQLEGEFENYDTTDAQNHAVSQVVKALNRILDERRVRGTFSSLALQTFTERILELQRGCLSR